VLGTIRAILAEIVGLFVDDGALALVGWCAAPGIVASLLPAIFPVADPVLFLGCALILLGKVVRAVRSR
jgi:hypothetical protein